MRTILINAVGARTGGAVTHLQALLPRLSDRNMRFEVFVGESLRDRLPPIGPGVGLNHRDLGVGLKRLLWDLVGLQRHAKEMRADLILSLLNHGAITRRVPQIILQRNPTYFARGPNATGISLVSIAYRRRLALRACKASELVLTPSDALRRDLKTWLDHPNIQVLPHGIDSDYFSPADHHLSDLPPGLPTASHLKLVYVAHVAGYKGHDELLRAFQNVKSRLPDAALALTFAGGEPPENGPAALVEELAERATAIDGIHLVGAQTVRGVRALYQWADVALFPSRLESFGFPLIEAMAMAKPVVASDIPPLVELGAGISLHHPVADAGTLAELVIELSSDAARRASLGNSGRTHALELDWERYVEHLIGHINSVLR